MKLFDFFFPIYKNDGRQIAKGLSLLQIDHINDFSYRLTKGEFSFKKNNCICGNENDSEDIVVSEKDQFGIPVVNKICSKCGLIRLDYIFDEESARKFYSNDYGAIYKSNSLNPENYFKAQIVKGNRLLELFNKYVKLENRKDKLVLDIGSGSGGVLMPFKRDGFNVLGVDFDDEYLSLGKENKIDLKNGNYDDLIEEQSVDVIILSHVFEHFSYPLIELVKIVNKIKINGYLIFEVPGIFNNRYINPIQQVQNAHAYAYFYSDYLRVLFNRVELSVVYSDESCTFILKKNKNLGEVILKDVYDSILDGNFNKIKIYLLLKHYRHFFKLNFVQWKNLILFLKIKLRYN